MIVAVVGSRTFADEKLLDETLSEFHAKNPITKIVSGGARGADSLAEKWARGKGIPVTVYPAEWEKYGRRAGMIRNRLIIADCQHCIAFWDGVSRGTKNDIDLWGEFHVPYTIVRF